MQMRVITGCEMFHALGIPGKNCRRKPAVLVFTGLIASHATISILCLAHARAVKELNARAERREKQKRKKGK